MRVVGIRRLSRGNAQDLDVERMALEQIRRVALAAERLGDLDALAYERPLRRRPRPRLELVGVHFSHVGGFAAFLGAALARGRLSHWKLWMARVRVMPSSSKLQIFLASMSVQPPSFCSVPSTMSVEDERMGRRYVS